jgi:hypothetical protein
VDCPGAIERFDATAALGCCTPDMTQIEYPNLLTPVTRRGTLATMAEGVVAARGMLAGQSYEIVSFAEIGGTAIAEMIWRGRLKPDPLPPEMTAYFAVFFTFRDGLIASQRNYDCFERSMAVEAVQHAPA